MSRKCETVLLLLLLLVEFDLQADQTEQLLVADICHVGPVSLHFVKHIVTLDDLILGESHILREIVDVESRSRGGRGGWYIRNTRATSRVVVWHHVCSVFCVCDVFRSRFFLFFFSLRTPSTCHS